MTLIGNKYHSTIKSKQLTALLQAGFLLFTNITRYLLYTIILIIQYYSLKLQEMSSQYT